MLLPLTCFCIALLSDKQLWTRHSSVWHSAALYGDIASVTLSTFLSSQVIGSLLLDRSWQYRLKKQQPDFVDSCVSVQLIVSSR